MSRKILTVITSATTDRVVVGESELAVAASKHFPFLGQSALLEIVEMTLKDPSKIFLEIEHSFKHLHYYYRLQNERYFVVVVKKVLTGTFLSSVYRTGKKPRNKHEKFKRIW